MGKHPRDPPSLPARAFGSWLARTDGPFYAETKRMDWLRCHYSGRRSPNPSLKVSRLRTDVRVPFPRRRKRRWWAKTLHLETTNPRRSFLNGRGPGCHLCKSPAVIASGIRSLPVTNVYSLRPSKPAASHEEPTTGRRRATPLKDRPVAQPQFRLWGPLSSIDRSSDMRCLTHSNVMPAIFSSF